MIEMSLRPKWFDYIFLYLLIFISNAFMLSQFSGTIRMIMYLNLFVVFFLINHRKLRFDKKSIIIYFIILFNISSTVLVNNEGVKQLLLSLSLFSVSYIYTIVYDFKTFVKIYVKVMYFLSVMSLILYFGSNIIPQMVTKLPVVYNVLGNPAYNMFFSTIHINDYLIRNQGIFWEPGAFQTFINLALIFTLFFLQEIKIRYLVVFAITLFTTFSTTGYIVGIGIILVFLLFPRKTIHDEKIRKVNKIIIGIIILIIVFVIGFGNLSTSAKYQIFGKVATYMENSESSKMSSTSVRIDAIIVPIEHFFDSPLFGNGSTGMADIALESGYSMNTATIINWFSMFGIFMGIIMNYGLYKSMKNLPVKKIVQLLLYLLFLISLISEDYVRNPSIIVFAYLGYQHTRKNKNAEIIFNEEKISL